MSTRELIRGSLLLLGVLSVEAAPPPATLAAESDVVVVAQLERVDYEYRRGFPVGGRAWFRVLLPYKVPRPMQRLVVYEEGLKAVECYFPDLPATEEMPRYLLFLVHGEQRRLRGHPRGCALEVLVTTDNRYAVRWPQERLDLDEDARHMVRELEFQGPLAQVDGSGMTRTERVARAQREHMRIEDTTLVYTRGILLEDFRPLMSEGLVADPRDDRLERRRRAIMEIIEDDEGG